jgi:DNA-directed RNA polymerase subunit RPC12/RpoP
MGTDRVTLKCGRCGSTQFSFPENPTASDQVTCADCGATSRYDQLQKLAVSEAKKQAEKIFKDAFKKWR